MLNSWKHLVGKKAKEEEQLKNYQQILEQDPNNLNVRLKLAELYAKFGDKKTAIQEYTTAAVQYADDGYLVKAIAVNKIIVRLEPSREEALERLSNLYFQRGIVADPLVQSYREAQQKTQAEIEEISGNELIREEEERIELTAGQEQDVRLQSYFDQIPLLTTLSDENQQWLRKHSQIHTFKADDYIISQESDEQQSLFILLNGEAKLYTKDKEGHDTLLDTITAGRFFGCLTLFAPMRQDLAASSESNLSVIAECESLVLEIPKPILASLIKREPELSESLLMEYYKRKTSDAALARVPLFSHLDPVERRKIAEHLVPVHIRKGVTIITEGEIGEEMYVIKSGQVGVYTTLMEEQGVSVIKTDQERLHLATLQEGDFFGEQALITHEPRSATIVALSDVQLLKFTKDALSTVVKDHPRVGTLLKKYHQQRISDTLESLKSIW